MIDYETDDRPDRATRITDASVHDGHVRLTWADGQRSTFHAAWLRHSPSFPGSSRPAGPGGRFPLAPGLAPHAAVVTAAGDLEVSWRPGDIETLFEARWLRENCYSEAARAARKRPALTWDAGIARDLPRGDHDAVMRDDDARLALFGQVLDHGFALLENVPAVPGQVAQVASLFGLIPAAPYAEDPAFPGIVDVRVNPAVAVATRKAHFLAPHTDTCWRQTLSGLVLMHCLKTHPQGGESMLVDGFTVAARLRERDPRAFHLLSTVPLEFGSAVASRDGRRDDWRALGRAICCDAWGEVTGIRYNGNSISQLALPESLVEPVYAALEQFEALLYDQALWLRLQLQPGQLLVMDNHRVLHGRTAFDPDRGERHLQTCAVDRDDFHNSWRRLARERGDAGWRHDLSWGVS